MLAACIADPELRQRLPEDFVLYLEFLYTENTRRNRALRCQLRQAVACLNAIDIEPLLLKGAIRLVDGLYPEPGWRFMRDLDLLIARDRIGEAVAGLTALGYRFTGDAAESRTHHRHLPALDHDDAVAAVEIHTDPLALRKILPAEDVLARSRLVDLDGARVRLPDTADQLGHLLGHDHFDSDLHLSGLFLLRSVFETALLCQDERPPGQLLARFASTPLARYARVRLALAARLFPDYFASFDVGLDHGLLARALIGLEQLDGNGGLRRLSRIFGYGRLQVRRLLRLPTWRKHLATNIRSPNYRHHCVQQLRRLWSGD